MRKHLIGTILVLAALAACNKEAEIPTPAADNGRQDAAPGKVTLTFKATIDEGTRTAYDADLNGSWVAGDALSVCVTDGTRYETADFTTTDGETFSGQVSDGYTTIVSGVYPASSNHVFTDGAVTSVYLPSSYDLGSANDGGIALPMVGAMESGTFTFHHICGALKIEIVDIFNALTFTTAETITGSFPLNAAGRIEIPAEGAACTVTFNYDRLETNPAVGERGNRTFFIPIPDGTLAPGATMVLNKRSNNTLIKAYEKTTTGAVSFSSNIVKRLKAIGLEHQEDNSWRIEVTEPDDPDTKGAVTQYVPTGTTFIRLFTTSDSFDSDYHGSVAEFIEMRGLTHTTYTSAKKLTMTNPISNYFGKRYVILTCEVNTQNERLVTFNYRKAEYEFASAAYLAWLGKWEVSDETNTDTWTITRKENNHTYTVTGLCNNTSNPKKAEAIFNNGNLKFISQFDFATVKFSGDDTIYAISLVGYNQNTSGVLYNAYRPYDLMEASLNPDGTASLVGAEHTYNNTTFIFSKYNLLRRADHTASITAYGSTRYLPATLTRVTE